VPTVLDANVEVDSSVELGNVLWVGFEVELDVQFLVLLPELEDLIRDAGTDRLELRFGVLVAFVAAQLLE
jgi:hypothetical protein